MALNPELETSGPKPSLYAGEVMIASRPSCRLALEDTAAPKATWFERRPTSPLAFCGAGSAYLTNFRLVFVADKPTQAFQSIELPLLYIREFDVVQPVFGANYLHGVCEPTADGNTAGMVKWRLSFMAGGMSTMVPLFYQTVAYVRSVASNRDAGVREPSRSGESAKPGKMSEFVASAVVDPNDPTVVFVVSEEEDNCRHGSRRDVCFDTAWSKKTQ
jgi:hypothetical protein